MKVSIIGAGNLATHLVEELADKEFTIEEIFSRNIANAYVLTKNLFKTLAKDELNFADSEAAIFFLAVKDDAIEEVIKQLVLPENAILAHTSGSYSLESLNNLLKIHHDFPVQTAVFYPVMTFSKGVAVDFSKTPICIEAYDEKVAETMLNIAKSLSNSVYLVDSTERRQLHLAAVFACNFTNHLLALSRELMDEFDLETELLKPLIRATVSKALKATHPADVQTGPAVRGDELTLQAHQSMLKPFPDLLKVYETLSESIKEWHEG
jgi:predicted short-subunit dehydrogenase-like oxidoreductase (DUF2520 family)